MSQDQRHGNVLTDRADPPARDVAFFCGGCPVLMALWTFRKN
jgi:hypothetical protein